MLLTGAFEPVDEARARAVGCDGVLVKPFEPQIVISRVKDLLAGTQPSGMWSAAPVAQGPVRQAAPDLELRSPGGRGRRGGRSARGVFRSSRRGVRLAGTAAPRREPAPSGGRRPAPPRREPIPLARIPRGRRPQAAPKATRRTIRSPTGIRI